MKRTKKELPTDAIANELSGSSVFFAKRDATAPAAETPQGEPTSRIEPNPQPRTDQLRPDERPNGRTHEVNARAHGNPGDALVDGVSQTPRERRPERYSFNFWADQITRLKRLKQILNLTQHPDGRAEITLSDLAREALDHYLEQQLSQLKAESADVRTDERTVG